MAGDGRFFTVRSYPRHLRTPGCPYHPLSIVLAQNAPKCVKSSSAPDQTAAIRLLRQSGQSQSAVARTFGVSRQTIWRAEQTE